MIACFASPPQAQPHSTAHFVSSSWRGPHRLVHTVHTDDTLPASPPNAVVARFAKCETFDAAPSAATATVLMVR
eukprot:7062202-Prymnesium_polylepis.2